jgi:hypothetical protein
MRGKVMLLDEAVLSASVAVACGDERPAEVPC